MIMAFPPYVRLDAGGIFPPLELQIDFQIGSD